jgi:hypothetical protein
MQERIKKPNLQRGLGGDGVLRGGEEREPHGLIALKVDLGGLEARKPAQQIVQLPLLHVGGEPRDEDGADLVGGGVGHGRGRRDDARGRRRRGRGWPLLVVRVDAGAGHGTLALERGGDGRRERAGRVGDVWIWIVVKRGRGCHGRVTSCGGSCRLGMKTPKSFGFSYFFGRLSTVGIGTLDWNHGHSIIKSEPKICS